MREFINYHCAGDLGKNFKGKKLDEKTVYGAFSLRGQDEDGEDGFFDEYTISFEETSYRQKANKKIESRYNSLTYEKRCVFCFCKKFGNT